MLARELSALRVPGVAVLGNHDFESGHQEEVSHISRTTGLNMLDGEACEVNGIGIAGVKGFAVDSEPPRWAPGVSRRSSSSCTRR